MRILIIAAYTAPAIFLFIALDIETGVEQWRNRRG